MYVFDNNKYGLKQEDYATIIIDYRGTTTMEIGENKPLPKKRTRKKQKGHINTHGIRKELLEYHYGIYRMFPCGKQHRYHMQYLHVAGVTSRSIR